MTHTPDHYDERAIAEALNTRERRRFVAEMMTTAGIDPAPEAIDAVIAAADERLGNLDNWRPTGILNRPGITVADPHAACPSADDVAGPCIHPRGHPPIVDRSGDRWDHSTNTGVYWNDPEPVEVCRTVNVDGDPVTVRDAEELRSDEGSAALAAVVRAARGLSDLHSVRAALEHLPETCRYHGAALDRPGPFGRACCDTGAAARARREALAALDRIAEAGR